MKDMLGNELKAGDLVAFAKPTGSNARMHLAIVVNPEKGSIFSMYTYHVNGELQQVYNSRPGKNASLYKLLQFDAADNTLQREIHAELKARASKFLETK